MWEWKLSGALMFTKTVFFVGFSFYIPEDSTARIAVSDNETSLVCLCLN